MPKARDRKKGRAGSAANAVLDLKTNNDATNTETPLKIEEEDLIEENNNHNNRINSEEKQIDKVATKATPYTANDDINEEFDFNDSLLKELSDKENAVVAGTVEDVVEEEEERQQSAIEPNGLNNNCISYTEHDTNTPASSIQAIADNNGHQFTSTITTTTSINDNNNDKNLKKPSNLLLLNESTANGNSTDIPNSTTPVHVDSYCPITPRCIMDVDSSDSEEQGKQKQQQPATRGPQHAEVKDDNMDGDDDDYDHEDDDGYHPDDELLVQFLGEANRIAEARLAARRQARAEAREIRMRELERVQREQENNADRAYADGMHSSSSLDPLAQSRLMRLSAGVAGSPGTSMLGVPRANSLMSSRRSSEDSLEEEGRSLRDIRHELKDVEERFRKAMIANAQLDNERASQTYQIQLLKDKLEEMEESFAQLQREFKEKSRDYNALKRNLDKLTEELKLVQGQLNERDTLIADQGLVIVAVENEEGTDAKRALVSVENAQLLGSVQGSLDVRLKKFSEEKQQLMAEVQQLQQQLEHYKQQSGGGGAGGSGKLGRGTSMNGPLETDEDYEAQREANKIISDYKYKLQKAEQEIASLQASLARSETQVIRYKSTAEAAEKAEAELKIERRKLQRENREAMERLEELETSNNHLLKRLDKLKNAKSALLKDL